MAGQKLRVGVIGAGEVAQVIHLPTLSLLSDLYTTTAISDISRTNLDHCQEKFHIPYSTTSAEELIARDDVDVVFILTSDEFHTPYAVEALRKGKNVLVEKPLSLSLPSAQKIIEAEKEAQTKSKDGKGARVFVGYMRRYAPSFTAAFKRELEGIGRIRYARVRDIVGPNAHFVGQSGSFPVKATDFPAGSGETRERLVAELMGEAFEGVTGEGTGKGEGVTEEMVKYARFLGSLGSHDLSLMREALGVPESVAGVSVNDPFYSAIFNYKDAHGHPYAVTYESGIDSVPRFDAHLAVYGDAKTVSIKYDTPYIKGLPIVVTVDYLNEHGEAESKQILSSFEDAYTAELREMWECFVNGREIKTSAKDAVADLELYDRMYKKWLS